MRYFLLGICAGILLGLTSCAFGGAKVTSEVIFVEPGAICKIATDKKIPIWVTVKDSGKDREVISEKNLAGYIAMPKSVYEEIREEYINTQKLKEDLKNAQDTIQKLREKLNP